LYTPDVTIIIVNKRISQRLFEKDADPEKGLLNPPEGTCLDFGLVEHAGDKGETFDFFLIAQQVTQGICCPVHYYVAFDSKKMKKKDLETLTYYLCYYYFNWSGPIKVPAPVMYAHKIAKYTSDILWEPHHKL